MRILAPFTDMHPATDRALASFAPDATRVDTSADVYTYWNAIADYWTGEHDLVIVEHDLEIAAGTLPSFTACPEPWCTYWYYWCPVRTVVMSTSLGCVRFSRELQAATPLNAISAAPVEWYEIDLAISNALTARGYSPHVHGQVKHHREFEIIYLDPPGKVRRWTWRDKRPEGYYPNIVPNDPSKFSIPDNAERVTFNIADWFDSHG